MLFSNLSSLLVDCKIVWCRSGILRRVASRRGRRPSPNITDLGQPLLRKMTPPLTLTTAMQTVEIAHHIAHCSDLLCRRCLRLALSCSCLASFFLNSIYLHYLILCRAITDVVWCTLIEQYGKQTNNKYKTGSPGPVFTTLVYRGTYNNITHTIIDYTL